MKRNTIDTQKAKQFYNLFLSIGVPKRRLDKSLDFSPEISEMVNKRIPMDHHFQLLSAGFALAEPGAALKIAHYTEGGISGLLYHLISHSGTWKRRFLFSFAIRKSISPWCLGG
jgi:hypothetical protein